MKAYLFPVALISLIFITACDKDDDNSGDNTKLLESYSTVLYPDTVSFGYNSDDQVIQVEDSEGRATIEINGNQLHYIDYRKTESREVANAMFTLNGEGNIISGQGSFSYNLADPYTANYTFLYDAQGNLVKRTDSRSNGLVRSYEYTWTNGDITKIKWIFADTLYFTENIEYDLALEDKNKIEWSKFLTATNSFVGNSSQHLRKNLYDVFAPGNTKVQEYNFAFTFDADGYPTTQTITGISIPSTDVLTYHYQ